MNSENHYKTKTESSCKMEDEETEEDSSSKDITNEMMLESSSTGKEHSTTEDLSAESYSQ